MKPRVIKDFEKLIPEIQEQIKFAYPNGFHQHLISYLNKEGKSVSVLPFETDETYYMVRMSRAQAEEIIHNDEDYDDDGILKEDIKDDYEEKYGDLEYMSSYFSEEIEEEIEPGEEEDELDD
ncbi:MAG: hypothetical protein OEY51_09530 [Cyclobacteriaceae bacterium]|nr:hypothetical protein [Cyclobacteriaceae bacterium]